MQLYSLQSYSHVFVACSTLFRINKKGSQKDQEQKSSGNYFFYGDDEDEEEVDEDL